jgi:hypothetical protein
MVLNLTATATELFTRGCWNRQMDKTGSLGQNGVRVEHIKNNGKEHAENIPNRI